MLVVMVAATALCGKTSLKSKITGTYRSLALRGDRMAKRGLFLIIVFSAISLLPVILPAQPMGPMRHRGGPYGGYCPGMQWGPYGVRKPVGTTEQAKQVIESYLSGNDQGLQVGNVAEGNSYFEAEILDRGKNVVDRVIVDKRSGRIRSIY